VGIGSNLIPGATRTTRGEKLKSGGLYEKTFTTPVGRIGILAEVDIEGSTVILADVAVYPLDTEHLEVEVQMLVRLRDALAAELAAMGFHRLRITGKRLSGASPGKSIAFTVDLTRYR
jgi:hypothetical protein